MSSIRDISIGKPHQAAAKTAWLIKGFILTVAKEIVDDVDWTTFCGRTRDLTMFKDLGEYWSDKDLGLKIYKVDEDDALRLCRDGSRFVGREGD
ncbi:hypothetical protein Leryth_021299 [Lithospermum erythrorhizon]|nr:hypothetical protein Leryth_021299 [Lithospermum erythrorhizon]